MLPEDGRERLVWPKPLSAAFDRIAAQKPRPVCVLATGDPLCFGVGRMLLKRISPSRRSRSCRRPRPSAWPARASAGACPTSRPSPSTAVRSRRCTPSCSPARVPGDPQRRRARARPRWPPCSAPAAMAAARSRRAGEHGRAASERRVTARADEWSAQEVSELNTIAVHCEAEPGTALLPRSPGLPDARLPPRRPADQARGARRHPGRPGALAGSAALGRRRGLRLHRRRVDARGAARRSAVAIESRPDRIAPDRRERRGARRAAAAGRRRPGARGARRPGGARRRLHRRRRDGAGPLRGLLGGAAARRPPGRQRRHLGRRGRRWAAGARRSAARWPASRCRAPSPWATFLGWRPLMPVTQFAAVKS